ncbi:MAG: DNA recombination protein RmuC [Flavobacteriales bacterium]|nr:DNA recombination protein RmuC [Flavobacteriales bacterium]MCB9447174.1 DNA recombination protein RmuC [Flavobacteriales bacterium]
MEFLYLLAGLVLGAVIARLYLRNTRQESSADQAQLEERARLSRQEADQTRQELNTARERIEHLTAERAKWEAHHEATEQKLKEHKEEMEKLREKMTQEFELVAGRILKQNTENFQESSQKKMTDILDPLKEKLKDFEQKVDTVHKESIRQNSTLAEQINGLKNLNEQMGKEAMNLANALKGDSKTQGDWGEVQLEMILEKAGLVKDTHYTTQSTYRDEEGKLKKPDFIINLPENKHMVIDAKVSLVAYERYHNDEGDDRETHLKNHILSIRNHIKELGEKNYQSLYHINTPDYVLMYIPIEPALTLALRHDNKLYDDALSRRIVLVTSSTLLATMRTVHFIWKQENLTRNVLEIARQGGAMYDKFVTFLLDLEKIEKALVTSQKAYHDAVAKINGHGGLMSRIEHLRKLGAKTTKDKSIPTAFKPQVINDPNLPEA